MKNQSTHSGFTLIELMISVSLGMLIVYVATSGLRTAAQSISRAQKLAAENAVIRAGMSLALAETDFWLSHDNPYDCTDGNPATPGTETSLRNFITVNSRIQGLPFTPMKANTDFNSGLTTSKITAGNFSQIQSSLTNVQLNKLKQSSRWDQNGFMAHDPRSWSWANLAERVPVKSVRETDANGPVIGNNGKVERKSDPSLTVNSVLKRQLFGAYSLFAATGVDGQPWQNNQLEQLKWTLGSYGMLEYIPANTPLATYSNKAKTPTPMWLISPEWCYTGGMKGKHYYLGADGGVNGVHQANDIMGITTGPLYSLANPYKLNTTADQSLVARDLNDLVEVSSKKYWSNIRAGAGGTGEGQLEDMLAEVDTQRPWLDSTTAPEIWPQLRVSSMRHVRTGQFICLNRITWIDNLTGKETEFSFTAFGSTLRGARQQRQLKRNKWANPFPLTGDADAHLDSYVDPIRDNL